MPDTTSAAALQIPAVGTYQLDPAASTVKFATRHLLGLAAVMGTFRLISGQVTIADPLTSSTASAVIDAASFATGNPRRDQDVKSARLLHVNDHRRSPSGPPSWSKTVPHGGCAGRSLLAAPAPRPS